MAQVLKVVGLMSGTSLDGVDAAILETDGEGIVRQGPALTRAYSAELRARLRAVLEEAADLPLGIPVPATIAEAESELTAAHVEAVRELLLAAGLTRRDVALIGFHGQTVLHRPAERRTWQIGDGEILARSTGIAVVNDFRSADVAAGGQGAPLAPLYHAALVHSLTKTGEPIVVLNIGGVANVTYVSGETILAFDTGPGNAAMDDWTHRHTGEVMDRDGKLAGEGRVDEQVLGLMLARDYFGRPPPKSLDRLDFSMRAADGLSPADGAATLTAFTAATIARAVQHFPGVPSRWIVCGGGRHNPVLMQALRQRLAANVAIAEDVGWRGDVLEAEAFAYLAMRSLRGLPLSLPAITGVPTPLTGGRLHTVE